MKRIETDYFPEQKNKSLEWARVPGERYWYDRIQKDLAEKVLKGFPVVQIPSFDERRMHIMSEHLRLSEKSAPALHAAMKSALQLLNRPSLSYDLFQIQGDENASASPEEDHPLIILQGKMLSMLDNDCLQSLLGHELGHCFCHSRQDNISGASGIRMILEGFPEFFKDDATKSSIATIRYAASAYLQCSELTADRIGVLATQSADVFLRETMIEMTGLQHDSIHWDIESFLAQCQVCVDNIKKTGVSLSTHPDTCFRAWAAWKFAQTDVFKQKTGKGSGNVKLADLNDEIMEIYGSHADSEDIDENLDIDEMPEEFRIFALCACFLMAAVDGHFCDEEADFIERFFADSIPDFKSYFDIKKVCLTINELTPYVARSCETKKQQLFTLLFLTLTADSVVDRKELILLMLLGKMLRCAQLWYALFEEMCAKAEDLEIPPQSFRNAVYNGIVFSDAHDDVFEKIINDIEESENADNADINDDEFCEEESPRVLTGPTSTRDFQELLRRPQVRLSSKEEAQNAIDLYCENVQKRGKSRTTLARLLRLAGMRSENRNAGIELFKTAFQKHQIESSPILSVDIKLQDIIELSSNIEIATQKTCEISEDSPAGLLIKAFSRLQATQVKADGRSQSVRCKQERPGRAFDMTRLNKLTHGRTERVLMSIEAEKETVMISPAEAGRSRQGVEMSHAIESLFREMKSRIDEQGASHLYLGSSFISGCIHGYEICAPLMLRGVELKRITGGVYGWNLAPIKGTTPKANHAVLRMIAGKSGASFTDEMIETLDEAALNGDDALTECVQKYGFFMGVRGGHKLEIQKDESTDAPETETNALDGSENAENHEEFEENEENSEELEAPDASEVIVEEDASVTDALYSIEKRTPVPEWKTDDWLCLESCSMLGFFPQSSSETLKDYNEILKELQAGSRSVNDILGSLQNVLPDGLKAEINPSTELESPHVDALSQVLPLVSLDPSQMEALVAARSGESLVIDGPPGTGKSQVIVGIVLDALARGLKVAVISEKRAALDVVAQRLTSNGFDDIYGIVHDVNKDKNELFTRIAQRMKTSSEAGESSFNQPEFDALCKQYQSQIDELTYRQQMLAIRDEEACFSDYSRNMAYLHNRVENTPELAPILERLKQRDSEMPFISKVLTAAEPRIVELISGISYTNLNAFNESLGRFIPFAQFFLKESWWCRHLEPSFLAELPEFSKFVDETILNRDENAEPKEVDDNTCLECWYQLFELVKSGLNPEHITKPWIQLVEQIEDFMPLHLALTEAFKSDADELVSSVDLVSTMLDDIDMNANAIVQELTGASSETTPISSISNEKLLDAWIRFGKHLQENTELQLQNIGLPWKQLSDMTAELIVARASIFRIFKPSWHRQEKAFRLWFEKNLPSQRPEKLTKELLQQISAQAQAYLVAQKLLVPCTNADHLGISIIQEQFKSYRQAKNQFIQTIQRLESSLMPEKVDESSIKLLLSQANRFVSLQSLMAPISGLENYGQGRVSALIHENLTSLSAQLLHLLDECSSRFPFISQIVRSYANIPMLSAISEENEKTQAWQVFTQCIWNESRLKSLAKHHPEILSLCSAKPQETCEERISRFKRIEASVTEKARQKLREMLLRQGILSVPKPLARARRTPEQKEVESIQDEASKKTRHLALRTFIHAHAQTGLLDIIPVWLLSPETMTVLFPRKPIFDLIVFDEASQATVASSLPALLRAKRWIIAGDDKQMPPSSFFAMVSKTEAEDDKPEVHDIFDSESLLTLARSRTMHTRLSYHYRSRHDELIAFSNYAFYDGDLKTVPAIPSKDSSEVLPPDSPERIVRWVAVNNGTYDKGRNPPEARQVAELLFESLKLRPQESVGVITFNINQRNEVLDAVDALCRQNTEFSELWDAAQQLPIDTRPFVKSIENVQGDERDAIFFSLGHCAVCRKGSTEPRVPARFGPLGQKGGERRLNVAISRAKIRTTVVASFEPSQLSVGNVRNSGPAFFKLFVEFIWAVSHDDSVTRNIKLSEASRIQPADAQTSTDESIRNATALNGVSLTAMIAAQAERKGFEFEQNVGLGPFKIPLAIYKPDHQPTAVLTQETSCCNAYDTSIHQPNMLIQNGWRVIQISPVDWLLHHNEIMNNL